MIPTKETPHVKFKLAVLTKDIVAYDVIKEKGSIFWVETHTRKGIGRSLKWVASKDKERWCQGLGFYHATININDCREPTEEEIQVHVALELAKLLHKYYPHVNHDCGMVALNAVFPKTFQLNPKHT